MDISKIEITPAVATIISSTIAAVVALSVFWLTRLFEARKKTEEKYDAVKKYANPIIHSSEQLAWRLHEILSFNGAYLLPNAPQNGFFKYKFESTVYRLCALLGWIQAAKKEQSYIQGIKTKHHTRVQNAINEFHKRLADGSHLEVSIIDELAKLYKLNLGSLTPNERSLLGVQMETIIFRYIPDAVKKNVSLLQRDQQTLMLREIMDCVCSKSKLTKVKTQVIEENLSTAINEVSREYCWIYRDWQSAIGDEMIQPIQGANRRFDVIGFSTFQEKHKDNEWLKRVDNLFANLDVSVEDRFDTRVTQLKELFEALVTLIETLKLLVKKQETISNNSLNGLKAFNGKINEAKARKKIRVRLTYE